MSALRPNALPVAPDWDFLNPEYDGADATWYATRVDNLAFQAQSTLTIDYGVDFYWIATSVTTTVDQSPQTESSVEIPVFTLIVQDMTSQKFLGNLSIPASSAGGAGERLYWLVEPRRIQGGTVLVFTWNDSAFASDYLNTWAVLHGWTVPAGNAP